MLRGKLLTKGPHSDPLTWADHLKYLPLSPTKGGLAMDFQFLLDEIVHQHTP